MTHFFIYRAKLPKRLRKSGLETADRSVTQSAIPIPNDARPESETQDDRVTRISCSMTFSELALLENARSQILRTTGKPCTTSAIMRAALITLCQRPVDEVQRSVEELVQQKPGRRPK